MITNPQTPPNRQMSDVLSPATRRVYDKSAENLVRWLRALEIMLVAYTLPHNLHAFGISWEFSLSMLLLALGVAVIEGAFLFSAEHFKGGLISSKEQYYYALGALLATTAMLVSNSILSHLLYLAEASALNPSVTAAMVWYQGFVLPITPIVALVSSLALIAHHPKVQQIGRTMTHVATVTAAEQSADRNLQQTMARMHYMRTETEAAKLEATLEAERMGAQVRLRKYQLEVDEQLSAVDFDIATSNAVIEQQIARMNEYLASEQFQRRIHTHATKKIGKVLQRLETGLPDETAAETPPPSARVNTAAPSIPTNIETAVMPQPVPTSYAPSTNGHYHPKA
jgi:hypothetical protein